MTTIVDKARNDMAVFEEMESAVRSYSRGWPVVFEKAKGYKLWDKNGNEYIDFFAGAGALNYGHNPSEMQKVMIDYIQNDGVIHSLDMATAPRKKFLESFNEIILKPRNMDYKVMFPGPTGTNTVESALKIARKVTGRDTVIGFTNAFHGMTIGSLSVTGNSFKRNGAGIPLNHAISMPFDQYVDEQDSIAYIERFLEDSGSGVALPAAFILETVQGEGGINAARLEWVKKIEEICRKWDILLIIDDVQAGCGRTGTFFSFEEAGINPDIVCLSKSIGGVGLPMAITLIKPEFDQWGPGEHNGTFRGNNLAFLAATEALNNWKTDAFSQNIKKMSSLFQERMKRIVEKFPELNADLRGRGLMLGIGVHVDGLAGEICAEAFSRGLILETSGAKDEVVKFLPPLIIDEDGIEKGMDILEESIQAALEK
ncbi:diaminobutyric acid aminotransferase [Oceanobacillus iheyensis HTE831]|uniref:Diaminobutyrate--2-oxoglutarate transaminase n=1 Tax=Oceanobacillus iheyensis (strain DSM 14371 / CIP 107618 / JCM 11309 / KCTC 3954 / HTE831) TaxID=221109 RepID=ECTB_OCEIH|nr:diaminobutyrate--2-oxoglutarate transaminase [Oceanobacillus iheyensis]Q8ESU8.1 RecName: Full=Diaminobutyrate--2-oxoglutarate transaminase; AltName: Full=DABA aminotransferase; AltName: Full=Diaminobutyrate--2-oxoglutarate aminotransferase; AltName: Full=L-2,4-diaminobutyric acid transaminase [Oceanobacillus iheyensis HTE831]BAC12474.1 diaminobutyric acid aminotransferase [Oceanobacillus iheyensis HTE831]